MISRSAFGWTVAVTLLGGVLTSASARPSYLQAFKAHYNTTQGKATLNAANCGMCHMGMPNTKVWNPYGEAYRKALGAVNVQDRAKQVAAFTAIEPQRNPTTNETFGARIAGDRLPSGTDRLPAVGGDGGPITAGEWEPVFNGVSMAGLTKMHAGNWEAVPGALRYTGGGNGWLRTNKMYNNYSAVIVWRYTQPGPGNDSGIFLKAREGDNNNPWPNSPQLNMGPGQNFGSLGGSQGSRTRYDLIRPNGWNTYQITVMDGAATLAINVQVAWEDQATSNALMGPGYIGIQAENQTLEIAQFWVRPLR